MQFLSLATKISFFLKNTYFFRADKPGSAKPYGDVSAQIDINTHIGTGEHRVTVKGMKIELDFGRFGIITHQYISLCCFVEATFMSDFVVIFL